MAADHACSKKSSSCSAKHINSAINPSVPVTVVRGCQERGDAELRETLYYNTEQRSLETGTHLGNDVNTGQRHWEH